MKNFGKGMWRRVGDYDKLYVPQINKNNELQYYLALLEETQKRNKKIVTNYIIKKQLIPKEEPIAEEPIAEELITKEEPIAEEPAVIEKKKKKKKTQK